MVNGGRWTVDGGWRWRAHICALLAVVAPACILAQQAQPWEQIPIPKLHAFTPHEPMRIELNNGIVVFLQEDHELPFVSGSVLIPGGSRDVDAAKAGLVDLYCQTWRTSGASDDRRRCHGRVPEEGAAHVETDGDVDSTSISWIRSRATPTRSSHWPWTCCFIPDSTRKLELARDRKRRRSCAATMANQILQAARRQTDLWRKQSLRAAAGMKPLQR